MTELTPSDIQTYFAFLKGGGRQVEDELQQHVVVTHLPAGAFVFWEGDRCAQLAIVLSGTVRVYKVGENGREITLYRIEEHESCILTASCILSHVEFPAFAVVEKEVRVALIPAAVLHDWMERFDVWREYVFQLMSKRLADVIATVEEIAFRRVDSRIAELLAHRAEDQPRITITHQEIAYELGSAREVVSRILKDFEREGLISLSRGVVTVENRPALLKKAQSP